MSLLTRALSSSSSIASALKLPDRSLKLPRWWDVLVALLLMLAARSPGEVRALTR